MEKSLPSTFVKSESENSTLNLIKQEIKPEGLDFLNSSDLQSPSTLMQECFYKQRNKESVYKTNHFFNQYKYVLDEENGSTSKTSVFYQKREELEECVATSSKSNSQGQKKLQLCPICNKSYTSQLCLEKHIKQHENNDQTNVNKPQKRKSIEDFDSSSSSLDDCSKKKVQSSCVVCNKKYSSKLCLEKHMRQHEEFDGIVRTNVDLHYQVNKNEKEISNFEGSTKKLVQKCTYCSKSYTSQLCLEKHMRQHEEKDKMKNCKSLTEKVAKKVKENSCKNYKCNVCGKIFATGSKLKSHNKIHSGERPYQCDYCKYDFREKSALKKHMFRHMDEKPFNCVFCQRGFIAEHHYFTHMQRHYNGEVIYDYRRSTVDFPLYVRRDKDDPKWFQCEICSKDFTKRKLLRNHLKTHGEKEFKCTFCEKAFYYKKGLTAHLQLHTREKIYICEDCGKTFYTAGSYYSHKKSEHAPNGKSYKCTLCEKSFVYPSNLAEHMISHTKEKSFQCDYCGKLFSYRSDFRRHVLINHEQSSAEPRRIYQCEVCSKTYCSNSVLTKHLKVHGERNFVCSVCSKAFHYKTTLKKHMETHDPDRNKVPYKGNAYQ